MFVQRDGGGAVKGVYRMRQPGYAEEELADDHPDVVDFLAPKPRAPRLSSDDLAEALIAKGVLTRPEVEARKK